VTAARGAAEVQLESTDVAVADRGRLGVRLYQVSHLTGTFTLRSGATSTEYFDKYRFEADPTLLREIGRALAPLVPTGTEVLAGLELGGVPLAVALGAVTGIPTAFVRKVAKPYGTCRLAEGADIEGRRTLVVEDVVTTAGQVVASVGELRSRGAEITHALCVIDREAGGADALAGIDVALVPLFTMRELGPD
jgi:orotate phosphoribosyltransferase